MMAVCSALYERLQADPRLKQAADLKELPLKPLVFDIMRSIAEDPEFRNADTSEKNRVAVMFGERMYRNHVEARGAVEESERDPVSQQRGPQGSLQDGPQGSLPVGLESVKEASLDAAALDERMQALANQVVHIEEPRLQPTLRQRHTEYLSLDSGDRDPGQQPKRYEFVAKLGEPLRSVAQLRVWSVAAPLRPSDPTVLSVRANVSHVWLWVDEVSGSYSKNSADVARRALCKLIVKSCHDPTVGRGYLLYEPVMEDVREFDPPLASLSQFTLSLRRQDGSLVDGSRDEFLLADVHLNSDAAANWVLTMDRYWEDASFMEGDVLRLSEVDTGFVELNAFLNRPSGHVILAVGYPVGTSFKTVVIRKPGEVDQATGIFEGDVVAHQQLQAKATVTGRVMNLSMQVSVSMTAICEVDHRHVDPSISALGQNLLT